MANADDLLHAGDIAGARAALVDMVRTNPSAVEPRLFLCQLLAVAGEWSKARTQLTSLASLSAEAQMLSVAYGAAIDAEAVRARIFAGDEKPAVLRGGDGWAAGLADSIWHFAAGRAGEGEAARDAALEGAPDTPGEIDGVPFDWIADADGRFGPSFEAIIAGQYGIIPFASVERITSEGPKDLRDIVWYPVEIAFRDGQSVPAMLPARYPGTEASDDAALLLSRATRWRDGASGEEGVGQHLLTLSSGEDVSLLSLRALVFT